MDWATLLHDPCYDIIGVEATIKPGLGGCTIPVTAIDKTAGIVVGNAVEVEATRPAAVVRIQELTDNNVSRSDLDGGYITLNGATWRIEATLPRPSPAGEAIGELYLILIEGHR